MKSYAFTGIATVTVCITVDAENEREAFALAREATSGEWECDEVDGEVSNIEVVGEILAERTAKEPEHG